MTLKTSLVLSGEEDGAAAVLANAEKALGRVEQSTASLARAQAAAKRETDAAKASYQSGELTLEQYNRAIIDSKTALSIFEAQHRSATNELRKLGSTATVSTGQAKAGYVNFGRQVQDVAQQLGQPGINIGTIIMQQGGQVADAVAEMGGKFSGFASFLRGPWGAGIIIGIGMLVNLAESMWKAGEASDDTKGKTLSLADALDKSRFGTEEATKAIQDYNAEQDRSRKNTEDMIKLNLASAEARLKDALAIRTQLEADLARQQNISQQFQMANPDTVGSDMGVRFAEGSLSENAAKIKDLRQSIGNLRINDAVRDAKAATDPIQAINNKYDDLAAAAKRAAAGNDKLQLSLKGLLTTYEKQRKTQLDAARDAQRTTHPKRSGLFGAEIDLGRAKSIAQGAGFTITSGARTRAEQQWLYDHKRTAENPVALPGTSAHEKGNALDIAFGKGVSPESLRKAFDAEGVRLTKILKETGHYHIEWSSKGADKIQREATQIDNFGQRAAESIARINSQFDEQPRLIDQAATATRELEKVIKGLQDKKPVNWEAMVSQARAAEQTIKDALVRPFTQLREESQKRVQIETLLTAGREDEARALQMIWQYEKQYSAMTAAQKQDVLELARSERLVTEELQRRQEMMGQFLDASRSMRQEVTSSLSGTGKISNLGQIFKNLSGQVLTEKLFGGAFRDLDTWIKGQSGIGASVDTFSSEAKRASSAAGDLADGLNKALASLGQDSPGAASSIGGAANDNPASDAQWADFLNQFDQSIGSIVVTASRPASNTVNGLSPSQYFDELSKRLTKPLLDQLDNLLGTKFFSGLQGVLSGALSGFLTGGIPGGIFGALKGIKGLPESISGILDKGLKGAQTGTVVAGIGQALGIKTSSLGGQIGGAIGSMLPIPGGQIIGAIAGSLLGGLFKKTKTGGVSLGLVNGAGAVTGTGGNNADLKSATTQAGGSVNGALAQIANQLGGTLGQFSVAIGMRKDEYRVSGSGNIGNTTAKKTGGDIIYKGKDEAAAIQAALANAIQDGAVKGLSAAVQKALQSSANIDQAIQEALKVQQVETAIGGIGAALAKQFADFEKQAAERLRIAQQYGFDVVAMEKRNAEDRLKLSEKLLAEQVGSLQQLIDNMTSGSLFEGSAVDQRQLLLDKIAAAKAEADAGTEGAADKLANLLEQLNSVSKEAFATTGTFAADRGTILDAARDSIAKANQRITDAQAGSDPALATTNATLDEMAGQNAEMLAAMGLTNAQLGQLISMGGFGGGNLAELARTTAVA